MDGRILFQLLDVVMDSSATLKDLEQLMVEQATDLFGGSFGGIKYFRNSTFYNGYSNVPKHFDLRPRKRGNSYRVATQARPKLMCEEEIQKSHPERHKSLRGIAMTPLVTPSAQIGVLAVLAKHELEESEEMKQLLEEYGLLSGRMLNMKRRCTTYERAIENRDSYISFAAHELKNPLSAMIGYGAMMARVDDPKRLKQYGDKMTSVSNRMNTLISELLDVEHAKKGKMKFEMDEVDMVQVVQKAVEDARTGNRERKLIYGNKTQEKEVLVWGDKTKLYQMVSNLIGNALKYSREDTSVQVLLKRDGDWLVMEIKDDGLGISPDDLPYIFNEFYRGDKGKGRKKGLGLGLFLVKKIVEKHGGEIQVESEVGSGSSFSVLLPVIA